MPQDLNNESGLFVVATPIGNLKDISQRAIEVLSRVDLIAAEDTRHSAGLLKQLGIDNKLISFHDYSDSKRLQSLIEKLKRGQSIALISDAGTPAISDPGFELVRLARQEGVLVFPVPGPSSMLAGLSVSGLPSDRFVFEGFLPARSGARCKVLSDFKDESRSVVLFESPHRIVASLQDMVKVLGPSRELYLGRELTKVFETSVLDSLERCLDKVISDSNQQRGEFVLVLSGVDKQDQADEELSRGLEILTALLPELSTSKAVNLAARISGASKNTLYDAALEIKNSK